MKKIFQSLVLGILLSTTATIAQAEGSADKLVLACSELINIYKSKEEKYLMAAQTTSVSEAMRAGYCRGLLEEYRYQQGYQCSSIDWFDMARFIAAQHGYEDHFSGSRELLEKSCDG